VSFAELPPEQRVAVVEGYVAKRGADPGRPRLDAATRALIYTLKRGLCDDELGEDGWHALHDRWRAHLAGLPELEADAAQHELRVFADYMRGLD
jgi:hypothetical protein